MAGAHSGGGAVRGAAPPPWIFRILRERVLSLTTAIEMETKRKKVKEKEEIYCFWSYDGQRNFLSRTVVYKCLVKKNLSSFFLFSFKI